MELLYNCFFEVLNLNFADANRFMKFKCSKISTKCILLEKAIRENKIMKKLKIRHSRNLSTSKNVYVQIFKRRYFLEFHGRQRFVKF